MSGAVAGRGSASGRRTRNVVRPPSDSASIEPLCASAIDAAIDSPNPKFPACRDRDLSARTNLSNRCGSRLGRDPGSVVDDGEFEATPCSHQLSRWRCPSSPWCPRVYVAARSTADSRVDREAWHASRRPTPTPSRARSFDDRSSGRRKFAASSGTYHDGVGEVDVGGVEVLTLVEPRQQQQLERAQRVAVRRALASMRASGVQSLE